MVGDCSGYLEYSLHTGLGGVGVLLHYFPDRFFARRSHLLLDESQGEEWVGVLVEIQRFELVCEDFFVGGVVGYPFWDGAFGFGALGAL